MVRHETVLTFYPHMCSQELRKELEKERDEHAAAASRGAELQQQTEELIHQKKVLEEIQKELNCENAELRQRAEALADSAETLLAEKHNVQRKVTPAAPACRSKHHAVFSVEQSGV